MQFDQEEDGAEFRLRQLRYFCRVLLERGSSRRCGSAAGGNTGHTRNVSHPRGGWVGCCRAALDTGPRPMLPSRLKVQMSPGVCAREHTHHINHKVPNQTKQTQTRPSDPGGEGEGGGAPPAGTCGSSCRQRVQRGVGYVWVSLLVQRVKRYCVCVWFCAGGIQRPTSRVAHAESASRVCHAPGHC